MTEERALHADLAVAVQARVIRPALLAKIETASDTVRVWSGVGDLTFNGEVYSGVGTFGGVSVVRETTEIEAVGVQYRLSGIPSSLISLALGQIRTGKPATLWFALINGDTGAVIGEPYQMHKGRVDIPVIEDNGETASITISAESRLIDLERPRVRRYTPEDQKIDYPNDRGFDFVAALQDAQIAFGGG